MSYWFIYFSSNQEVFDHDLKMTLTFSIDCKKQKKTYIGFPTCEQISFIVTVYLKSIPFE